MFSDLKSKVFRRRSGLSTASWEYELPEGKIATPEQLAEYRRRNRRMGILFVLIMFGFIPMATWVGFTFLHNPVLLFIAMILAALTAGFLLMLAERTFRCPVCDCQFEVWKRTPGLSQMSPERRKALYGRFRWCDCCGTRFEIYPPSVVTPSSEDDNGLGIL